MGEAEKRMLYGEPENAGAHLAASPRLFRNPLLDKFSRVNPGIPFVLYVPIAAALLWQAATTRFNTLVSSAVVARLLKAWSFW